ncbi:MAG: hypothetical protein HYZ88_00470 [Candidatus Omnitrophica bacterium]|nr:hypothetical protein [Candidatus Omnitrophota bacterium]
MVRGGAGAPDGADRKLKTRSRWFLPSLLLGIYLFLKFQGWVYTRNAADLERQLEGLRPGLAAKVQHEQLERTRQACLQAGERIQQLHLEGEKLLQWLSAQLPASITLQRVQLRANDGLRIQGMLLPGVRNPESVIVPWAQKLQTLQPNIRVLDLVPLSETPGAWSFELRGEAR